MNMKTDQVYKLISCSWWPPWGKLSQLFHHIFHLSPAQVLIFLGQIICVVHIQLQRLASWLKHDALGGATSRPAGHKTWSRTFHITFTQQPLNTLHGRQQEENKGMWSEFDQQYFVNIWWWHNVLFKVWSKIITKWEYVEIIHCVIISKCCCKKICTCVYMHIYRIKNMWKQSTQWLQCILYGCKIQTLSATKTIKYHTNTCAQTHFTYIYTLQKPRIRNFYTFTQMLSTLASKN